MNIETAFIHREATGGREPAVDFDTDMPASSALLSESMGKKPFAPFFASTGTHEAVQDDAIFARSVYGTPLLSDEPARQPSMFVWRAPESARIPEPTREEQVAKANYERVALLARKYVAKEKFTDEESARLAIATERVRKLLPAVTGREYEALEGILKDIQEIRESDKAIRARVGIARRRNA